MKIAIASTFRIDGCNFVSSVNMKMLLGKCCWVKLILAALFQIGRAGLNKATVTNDHLIL